MIQIWKTVFILCISVLISFFTTFIRSHFTDKKQLNTWKREIAAWNTSFKEARSTNNKKLLDKVQKERPKIMKMQTDMSWKSMRISLILILPFFLVWLGLTGGILGIQVFETPFSNVEVLAYLPWFGDAPFELSLIWWYFLCSIASGILFTRIFDLGMGVSE